MHKGIASTVFAHERQWSLIACICRRLSEEQHAWASSTVFYRFNHTWGSRGKETTRFLVPEQVTPLGELANHASLGRRKRFKSCKFEGAERCGCLHGRTILGKRAMIFWHFLLLSWLVFLRLALVLLSFFIHFMVEGVNLLSAIFWEKMGNKWATHTIMFGLDKQIFQAPSSRSTWKSPADRRSEAHWGNRFCQLDGIQTRIT